MSRYLDKRYSALAPYVPGEQPRDRSYIKLNTNESPFEPSPMVLDALSREQAAKLNLYNDPTLAELICAIAGEYGVDTSNVTVGNGSDELLAFAFCAFCGDSTPMVCPEISYGFYPVFCEMFGIPYTAVPVKPDLSIDLRDYYGAAGNVTIANPNAQTGIFVGVSEIEKLLKAKRDSVVIVDEAYIDFGGESCLPLIKKYDNLLVVRTFSKSRSLAGGRVGYALGNAELIKDLDKMRYSFNPYNVNRLSQAAALAAIKDREYFARCTEAIKATRAYTAERLKDEGFYLTDSLANFLLARLPGIGGEELYKRLKARGILVRFLSDAKLCDYVRITVGTKEMTDALIAAIRAIKEEI